VLCVHTETCTHTVECRYLHGLCTYLAPLGISCVVCTHRHVHTHSRGPLRARTVHLPFAPPPLLLQVHNRLAAVLAAATTRIRMSGYYDLWTSMYQYAVRFSFFLTPLTFFLQRKICYFYCKERVGLNWGILLSLAILTDTCCKVWRTLKVRTAFFKFVWMRESSRTRTFSRTSNWTTLFGHSMLELARTAYVNFPAKILYLSTWIYVCLYGFGQP